MAYAIGARARPSFLQDHFIFGIILFVVVADQLSKHLIQRFLVLGESFPVEGPVRFTYVINSGAAFGLFRGQSLFLTGASLVGIAILILFYRSQAWPGRLLRISLGLQLGGAVGNLVDRLRSGEVVDFIDMGAWPIFNLADSSIVLGIGLLVGIVLFSDSWHAPRPPLIPPRQNPPDRPPPEAGC